MILLSYDVETTGLDKQKDRIIEAGFALYSTGQQKVLESAGYLVKSEGVLIAQEITDITGITQAAVDRFGHEPADVIEDFNWFAEQADAVIAHNGNRFDLPVTENTVKRLNKRLEERLWIDTMTDIPSVKGEQLITMCAKVGFVYNAHAAEDDAKAVLEMTRRHAIQSPNKSFEKMVERAKSPIIVLRSHQPNTPENNRAVGKVGFRWNGSYKIWWRATKEMDVNEIAGKCPFDVSRVDKEITVEQLES